MSVLKLLGTLAAVCQVASAISSQSYTWKNVKIGGGGGFVRSNLSVQVDPFV
jgi:hypothetical protein